MRRFGTVVATLSHMESAIELLNTEMNEAFMKFFPKLFPFLLIFSSQHSVAQGEVRKHSK